MHVRQAALARVEAGEGVYAVARDVGVGPDRVYAWMKAAGVVPPQTKSARAKDLVLGDAVQLWQAGMSIDQAAAAVGLTEAQLRYRLQKAGLVSVKPGKSPTPMHVRQAALARVEAGEGVYAVARDVGVGPDRVYAWMKAAGVTPP
ncbi:hypothetical protein M5J20_03500, partial [Corynebacterium sp. TA-R-1]